MSSQDSKQILDKVLTALKQSSATKQLLIGSASGWTTGFLTMKVGKPAAFAVGGSIILFQLAQNQGYVKMDWPALKAKTKESLDNTKFQAQGPEYLTKVKTIAKTNIPFTAGFIGGFLIGLGF